MRFAMHSKRLWVRERLRSLHSMILYVGVSRGSALQAALSGASQPVPGL